MPEYNQLIARYEFQSDRRSCPFSIHLGVRLCWLFNSYIKFVKDGRKINPLLK